MKNKRIFITGGTGFLGKNLIHHCQQLKEHDIVLLSPEPEVRMQEFPLWRSSKRIKFLRGDIRDFEFPAGDFDYIIHDPPRHNFAVHLYGKMFYKKLAEVMKPNGKLFHYTGEPRSRYRRVNIQRGVMKRLGEVGFKDLEYHPSVMGITCTLCTA